MAVSFLPCSHRRPCDDGSPASCASFNDMNFAGHRPDGSHAITDREGNPLGDRFFGQSSFATHAIVHERNAVKVRDGAPLELLGPLGCGIQTDAVEEIRRITGTGVDYALDTTGLPALILQCVDGLRQRGTAAILGASRPDAVLDIPANELMQSCKTIKGVVEGDSVPDVFVPQLLELHMQGRLPFDRLVTFYDLDQIDQATADAESGAVLEPILRMG